MVDVAALGRAAEEAILHNKAELKAGAQYVARVESNFWHDASSAWGAAGISHSQQAAAAGVQDAGKLAKSGAQASTERGLATGGRGAANAARQSVTGADVFRLAEKNLKPALVAGTVLGTSFAIYKIADGYEQHALNMDAQKTKDTLAYATFLHDIGQDPAAANVIKDANAAQNAPSDPLGLAKATGNIGTVIVVGALALGAVLLLSR